MPEYRLLRALSESIRKEKQRSLAGLGGGNQGHLRIWPHVEKKSYCPNVCGSIPCWKVGGAALAMPLALPSAEF